MNIIDCLCIFIRYSLCAVRGHLPLHVLLLGHLLHLALNKLPLFLILVCFQDTLSSVVVHLPFEIALVVSLKLLFELLLLLLFVFEADHVISHHQFPSIHIAIIWFVKALDS